MSLSEKQILTNLKPKSRFGARHVQVLMLFLSMTLAMSMNVNMSMAIIAMTDHDQEQHFDWSTQTQSVILSSFFWGIVVLQIPAGELSKRIGGMWLILIVISVNSVVTLMVPFAATYGDWQGVCACRVLQGLSQGFLFPASHTLISKWVPREEKTSLGSFVYTGTKFGTALQYITAGFLAEYLGWQYIFYVNGIIGLVWSIAYFFIGSDSPQNSKIISEEERMYIQTSLDQIGVQNKLPTPWKNIWTSLPFIALIVAHSGHNWGFFTLMTEMPSFMNKVLGVDIRANGMLSAIPYLTLCVVSIPFGLISDYIIKREILSVTATRKLFNIIGEWGPALALIGLSYAPAGNVAAAVVLLSIVVGLNAGYMSGFQLVHIDMAPNFGGNLMGITNFFANIVSIMAPLVAGQILVDETSMADWRKVFYVSSAIYFLSNLFFVVFGTSEVQPWNYPVDDKEALEKDEKLKAEKV